MNSHAGRRLGRYRLESSVGQGGMAEVYRALDDRLERAVAVKVILPAFAGEAEFRERFLREARLVAGLEHPHVLPIYDFGEADGVPYLVMPFLDGGTLEDRLKRERLSRVQVVDVVRQLGTALDHAHAAGILHRDVKPANVLLGGDGRLILGDFGIARLLEQSTRLTNTGMMVGTPAYMAPELARGEAATAAADRYALACLAFEMLSGAPPFKGENALSLLHQHVNQPVPSLSEVAPSLPPELDAVFARALAKDPAERPATCAELAGALSGEGRTLPLPAPGTTGVERVEDGLATLAVGGDGGVLGGEDGPSPLTPLPEGEGKSRARASRSLSASPRPSAGGRGGALSPSSDGHPVPSSRKRPLVFAVVAVVGLLLLVGAGFLVARFLGGDETAPAASLASTEGARSAGALDALGTGDGSARATDSDSVSGGSSAELAEGAESDRGGDAAGGSSGGKGEPATGEVQSGSAAAAAGRSVPAAGRSPDGSPGSEPATTPAPGRDAGGRQSDATGSARSLDRMPAAGGDSGRASPSDTEPEPAGSSEADEAEEAAPRRGRRGGFDPRQLSPGVQRLTGRLEQLWLRGRPGTEVFAELLAEARRLEAEEAAGSPSSIVKALGTFLEAGVAYVDGDAEGSQALLVELAESRNPVTEVIAVLPVRSLRSGGELADWQLAIAFGDPLGTAAGLIDAAEAADVSSAALTLGRALVAHLDGDHAAAAGLAAEAESAIGASEAWRRELVIVIGTEHVHAGELDQAIERYQKLGREPGPVRRAVRNLEIWGGRELVRDACRRGYAPACLLGRRGQR